MADKLSQFHLGPPLPPLARVDHDGCYWRLDSVLYMVIDRFADREPRFVASWRQEDTSSARQREGGLGAVA